MKLQIASLLVIGLACELMAADDKDKDAKKAAPAGEDKAELKTTIEKASYSIGFKIGTQFKSQSLDLDAKSLIKGLQDALGSAKCSLSETEMREVMDAFQKEHMARDADRKKGLGDKNKKAGEAFLAENKSKPGVTTLPSGLQYKVLEAGTGPKPKATDTVTTHYRGTLIDGTEFDSSYSRGEPTSFGVTKVIKGWTEALQLMPVGSKWVLYIPSELAYGPNQMGPTISPNSTLIFELQLIAIK